MRIRHDAACAGAHQIRLHPRKRLTDAAAVLRVEHTARILRIHLEEPPRRTVHHDDMRDAIVHGKAVSVRRCVQMLCLRSHKERLKERTVVVVAPRVENGRGGKHLRNALKPILLVLIVLISRAEGNVSAMQNEVRLFLPDHRGKPSAEVKELRVRYRHEMKALRRGFEGPERAFIQPLRPDPDSIATGCRRRKIRQAGGIEPHLRFSAHALPFCRDGMGCPTRSIAHDGIPRLCHLPRDGDRVGVGTEQIGTVLERPFSCHCLYPSMLFFAKTSLQISGVMKS